MKTAPLPPPLTWLQPFDFPHKLGICDRIFGKGLARHGICWAKTTTGSPWKLDLTLPNHRWLVYGKYDTPFLNWAREFLPPNGIVVDSGANIGQMLVYLAQWVYGLWARVSDTEGEPIQMVRLEDELSSRSIENVDLWKLDVEGFEIPAMQGAEALIKEQRIRAIYAELGSNEGHGQAIRDYLAKFGYQGYAFDKNGKLNDSLQKPDFQFPAWMNGLFLPE